MIRNKIKIDINEALNRHKYFSSSDFEIQTKGQTITIKYEYDPKFYFKITLPARVSTKTVKSNHKNLLSLQESSQDKEIEYYEVTGKVCPGGMVLEEDIRFEGKEIESQIEIWLSNMWQEIKSIPLNKIIEEQNTVLEQIKSRVNEISEDYFTKEESEELQSKLDALEEKLKVKIQEQASGNENINQRLKDLEYQIDVLRETVDVLNKRNWFKSSMTKMYKWISKSENRKLLKDGSKLLKPLLPDSIKDIID